MKSEKHMNSTPEKHLESEKQMKTPEKWKAHEKNLKSEKHTWKVYEKQT